MLQAAEHETGVVFAHAAFEEVDHGRLEADGFRLPLLDGRDVHVLPREDDELLNRVAILVGIEKGEQPLPDIESGGLQGIMVFFNRAPESASKGLAASAVAMDYSHQFRVGFRPTRGPRGTAPGRLPADWQMPDACFRRESMISGSRRRGRSYQRAARSRPAPL